MNLVNLETTAISGVASPLTAIWEDGVNAGVSAEQWAVNV